jgi:hypothetical protein
VARLCLRPGSLLATRSRQFPAGGDHRLPSALAEEDREGKTIGVSRAKARSRASSDDPVRKLEEKRSIL